MNTETNLFICKNEKAVFLLQVALEKDGYLCRKNSGTIQIKLKATPNPKYYHLHWLEVKATLEIVQNYAQFLADKFPITFSHFGYEVKPLNLSSPVLSV